MDIVGAIAAGLGGTAVMTILMYVAPMMGMPKMDIVAMLGLGVATAVDIDIFGLVATAILAAGFIPLGIQIIGGKLD